MTTRTARHSFLFASGAVFLNFARVAPVASAMRLLLAHQPFVAGLRRLRNLWVYTSRGTGYWGPPNRFGIPSEISFLRLAPAG